jgi:hypothetical protein
VDEYIPTSLGFLHPLQSKEWLSELGKIKPSISKPSTITPLKHTWQAWSTCISDILSSYTDPKTRPFSDSAEILNIVTNGKGPHVEYPMLHPYVLPGMTHFMQQLMTEFRNVEALFDAQRYNSNRTSTTLLLFSPQGMYTPFHFDWTEAKNLALEIKVGTAWLS